MNDTHVNTTFREQSARWLAQAMAEAGLTDAVVIRVSGVAKTTFYALKQGDRDPDQETLDTIAAAIGRPAPQIARVLLSGGVPLSTPLAMVRDAKQLLERLEKLLPATLGEADPAGRIARAAGKAGGKPTKRGQPHRRASGE